MGNQMRRNHDGTITLTHETQTFNQERGSMDIEVHGEITMTQEEWSRVLPDLQRIVDDAGFVGGAIG